MRRHPLIYEINTALWLDRLSKRYERPVTLDSIPDEVIEELASWGFDAIWMMGVWERSPRAREIALHHPGLLADYARTLPDYQPEQILGSPYAVYRYQVDERFGGRQGLATFRGQLVEKAMGLILDYVPNHTAIDHPWIVECPRCLVQGTAEDRQYRHTDFFSVTLPNGEERIYAHGRDPYFPPWSDTAQIDAFSPEARENTRRTLHEIAQQCDGVRCDMAMLLATRIFAQTWSRADKPLMEFWTDVIPFVKAHYPEFIFIAEVYWNMEPELQALGFDFTYDKTLYDRSLREAGYAIRDHIMAPFEYQQRMVRFVENHDEARAITAFGPQRAIPAAALAATLPGMRMFYEGQFEGRRVKIPVQLGVAPYETPAPGILSFYRALISEVNRRPYHDGQYMILGAHPAPGRGNPVHEHIVAYAWALGEDWRIVVANFADQPIKVQLSMPRPGYSGTWCVENALNSAEVTMHAETRILTEGLHVDMVGYSAKILRVSRV